MAAERGIISTCHQLVISLLGQIRKEKLYQFAWHPRPKDVLTSVQKKAVVKNLRKYEKIFDAKDRERKQQLFAAAMVERRSLAEKFFSVIASRRRSTRLAF